MTAGALRSGRDPRGARRHAPPLTYRRVGTRSGSGRGSRRSGRERAPSSLGCVAAPISSGPRLAPHRRRRPRHRRTGPGAETPSPPRRLHRRPPAAGWARGPLRHRSGVTPGPPGARLPSALRPDPLRVHPCGSELPVPNLVRDRTVHCTEEPSTVKRFRVCDRVRRALGYVRPMTLTEISEERFEALVADALDSIPEELGSQMDNVAVMVEDWPTPAQLGGRTRHAARPLRGHRPTRAVPIGYAGVDARPHHDLPRPAAAGRARRGRPRAAGARRPCSTRSATTSACRTPGCTSSGGREIARAGASGLAQLGTQPAVRRRPRSTSRRSLLEVVEAVGAAARAGQTVKVVASGHSFTDVACTDRPHAAPRTRSTGSWPSTPRR